MTERRIAAGLFGHSHMNAIAKAISEAPLDHAATGTKLGFHFYDVWQHQGELPYLSQSADGQMQFNPALLDALGAKVEPGNELHIFTIFGGNEHNALALTESTFPVDLILPGETELPFAAGAELVPVGYVKSILAKLMAPYDQQLRYLRAATTVPIYHIEAPPPLGDHAFVREHLDAFFQKAGMAPVIAANSYRLKVWRLQCALRRALCAEIGVTYVPVPREAFDRDGFLRSDFYGSDATHANALFGTCVLRQIETRLSANLEYWTCFA